MPLPFTYRRRYLPVSALQNDFSQGMLRDVPLHEIPPNGAYTIHDFLIDQHGQLRRRGRFTNWSSLSGYGGANVPRGVYLAQFPLASNAELVLVPAASGNLYRATATTSTSLGAWFSATARGSWAFYIDKVIACPGFAGNQTAAAPKKVTFDGTTATLAALGGSPPSMNVIAMYKSRLCGGGDIAAAHPNRVYFSPVPAIDGTWDTTNAWVDCEHNVKGLAALRNLLLVFSDNAIERIIGDTPPPGTNMDRTTISNIGLYGMPGESCITVWNDNAIYANTQGVYMTNGSPPVDLTTLGGIKQLWRSLNMSSSSDLCIGVYRDTLMITSSASTMPGVLCFDLIRKSWFLMGGQGGVVSATQMAMGTLGGVDEMLFVDGTWGYSPVQVSSVFLPVAATYTEATNGRSIKIKPQLTTRVYTGEGLTNLKRFSFARITNNLLDPASTNPTWTVTPSVGLEADRALTAVVIAENTVVARNRIGINAESQGVQLDIKVTTGDTASEAQIYGVEVEAANLWFSLEGVA